MFYPRKKLAFELNASTSNLSILTAIYHLHSKVFSRGKGQSAVAAAAYRASTKIKDIRNDKTHDYRNKKGTIYSTIIAPPEAPSWAYEREMVWNQAEASERRVDGQVCREIELAAPAELTVYQNITLIDDFVRNELVSLGMVADISLHSKDTNDPAAVEGQYIHGHILLSMRQLTLTGFSKNKERSWNSKKLHQRWREQWQAYANKALEKAGEPNRIDHRTLEAQKVEALLAKDFEKARVLDRKPEPKIGVAAMAIHRKGLPSRRYIFWKAVKKFNLGRSLRSIKSKLSSVLGSRHRKNHAPILEPSPKQSPEKGPTHE